MPTISLKTVYQTVHDLEEMGEVTLLDLGTGSVRVDPNVERPPPPPDLHALRQGPRRPARRRPAALPARYRRGFKVDAVEVHLPRRLRRLRRGRARDPSSATSSQRTEQQGATHARPEGNARPRTTSRRRSPARARRTAATSTSRRRPTSRATPTSRRSSARSPRARPATRSATSTSSPRSVTRSRACRSARRPTT